MIKFSKVLAINCLILLLLFLTVWVGLGIIFGIVCRYSLAFESFLGHTPEQKYFLDNRDLIGYAVINIKFPLIMTFPYALVITLGLKGRIAYSQTLAKSQRGRDFVERIKSLDISLGRALRRLVGNKHQ